MHSLESQNVDLTSLQPIHEGKWVVMSRSTRQVFAFNESPRKALEEAKNLGCKDPILQKIMPFDKGFISYT